MTNHYIDFKNTDCALIMGSNAAENHPMGFKWLLAARQERGAKIIHVDPRFTRTSAQADIYAPLRSGTDIAFIGGMINYILQNNLYWKEYVVKYTNAPFLVSEKYDFQDGLFSGYDPQGRKYDQSFWAFQMDTSDPEKPKPLKDETLQHPRCVFQLLKKHYSRYDLDTVSAVTGTPKDLLVKVYEAFAATGKPDKSGTILYAMGTTQHTVGSQNVRAYVILQLLLGNIGVPGGGINALRGESNVQGSTDFGLLFGNLPGYLNAPVNTPEYATLEGYLKKETPKTSYWVNRPKFMVSYLKALYGPAATKENEFCYQYLPKRDAKKNYSHIALFEAMSRGEIKGLMCWGQNPVVGGPSANKEAAALANLDWLVAVDLWETETAAFWKRPGVNSSEIKTEVFLLPAAASYEKEGSISNSGRWAQYRWKGAEPVGESRADLDIIHQLALRLKKAYAGSKAAKDQPIVQLWWDYGEGEECDIDRVAKEISGYDLKTGQQLITFGNLMDDGSTVSGCWIYCGSYTDKGNLMKRRDNTDTTGLGQYLNWSWVWPVNRRILYNRCSADPSGKPWSQDKALIWWDPTLVGDPVKGTLGKWTGKDVPDFNATLAPNAPGGQDPFIMMPHGVGGIFANLNEGPFPEHYEPWESPVKNLLSSVQFNPVVKVWEPEKQGTPEKFPIVATTYRVTEHWQAGAMTRNLPWLAELVPAMFVEISESLAKAKGIRNGQKVIVSSTRGEIEAIAVVTPRLKPLVVNGQPVEEVGLIWHFGYQGIVTGDIANKLTPHIGDGNTMIPEYKAFLVDVRGV